MEGLPGDPHRLSNVTAVGQPRPLEVPVQLCRFERRSLSIGESLIERRRGVECRSRLLFAVGP